MNLHSVEKHVVERFHFLRAEVVTSKTEGQGGGMQTHPTRHDSIKRSISCHAQASSLTDSSGKALGIAKSPPERSHSTLPLLNDLVDSKRPLNLLNGQHVATVVKVGAIRRQQVAKLVVEAPHLRVVIPGGEGVRKDELGALREEVAEDVLYEVVEVKIAHVESFE
jgi:hypothetical protein